jgi:hypothetical protein
LRAGATADLELDLRPFQPAVVRVRVADERGPIVGARVVARAEGRGERYLGATDDRGELRADVPARRALRFAARSPAGLDLGGAVGPVALEAGGETEVRVEVSPGELTLAFPDDFDLPPEATLHVMVRPADGSPADFGVAVLAGPRALVGEHVPWEGGAVELGRLASGRYALDVSLDLIRFAPEGEEPAEPAAELPRFTGEVLVEAGARARCELRAE